jgi:hypothetical protein
MGYGENRLEDHAHYVGFRLLAAERLLRTIVRSTHGGTAIMVVFQPQKPGSARNPDGRTSGRESAAAGHREAIAAVAAATGNLGGTTARRAALRRRYGVIQGGERRVAVCNLYCLSLIVDEIELLSGRECIGIAPAAINVHGLLSSF